MKHLCGEGSGEKCKQCEMLRVRLLNTKGEIRFLRRQFALLRDRCDRILLAEQHMGGRKFF